MPILLLHDHGSQILKWCQEETILRYFISNCLDKICRHKTKWCKISSSLKILICYLICFSKHDNRDSNLQSGFGNRGNNRFRGYDRRRNSLRGTARGRPWYKKGIEGRNRNVNRYLETDDKKPHTSNQAYQTSRQDRLTECRDRTRERSVDSGYYKRKYNKNLAWILHIN